MLSKRIFDLFFVIPGLLLLSPVLIFIALFIKLKDGGNVLFKQVRVGQHGKNFEVLKFRTMVLNAEKLGNKVTTGDDPRITSIGQYQNMLRFIRMMYGISCCQYHLA